MRRIWYEKKPATAYRPSSVKDLDQVARIAESGGKLVLLIDEAHYWLSGKGASPTLLRIMRATRHSQLRILLTTQHLSGDIPQAAFACAPDLYLFRTTAPRSLKVLESEFELDPEILSGLRAHYFIRKRTSF